MTGQSMGGTSNAARLPSALKQRHFVDRRFTLS